jgi:hypothetical protein
MNEYFHFTRSTDTSILVPSHSNTLLLGLKQVVGVIKQNKSLYPTAVKSEHLLVQILQAVTVPKTLPYGRYYDHVRELEPALTQHFKLTNSFSYGRLHQGVFYKDQTEVLLSVRNLDVVLMEDLPWREFAPVKVLRHGDDNLMLPMADGRAVVGNDLCVLTIDIPMLALMYRGFVHEQRYFEKYYNRTPKTLQQFVSMYVLPQILDSHVDVALMNRLLNLYHLKATPDYKNPHAVFVTDFNDLGDRVMQDCLKNLKSKSYNFAATLRSIPAFSFKNQLQATWIPEMPNTRQAQPALAVCRLPVLMWLIEQKIDLGGQSQLTYELNYLRRFMQQVERISAPDAIEDQLLKLSDMIVLSK